MDNKILIIGNGFDLDLGLKSRYSDFMGSKIWQMIKRENSGLSTNSLIKHLEDKYHLNTWFDVENELLNYALEMTEGPYANDYPEDQHNFDLLKFGLKKYLDIEQQNFEVENKSIAKEVIEMINQNGYFKTVYTFNYTSLNTVLSRFCVCYPNKIVYMHGSLKGYDDIVLGIETDKTIRPEYTYLFKTNSRYYQSNSLIEDMENADEIVFFGHSINGMDFPYFKDFFLKQSRTSADFKKKYITIFTYDDASDRQIRDNFREVGINPRDLMQRNKVLFIQTSRLVKGDKFEQEKYKSFKEHLGEDCKGKEDSAIRSLEQALL